MAESVPHQGGRETGQAADDTCPNCGTITTGRYCPDCGQKRLEPGELSLRHFFAQFLNALFHLDSRLLRSLGLLVIRPGRLLSDYLAGRRVRHTAPLILFLVANLLYFFSPPVTDMNPMLRDHLEYNWYGGLADKLVQNRLDLRDTEFEGYAVVFEARQANLAKTLIILHVPLMALGLAALHWRRRLFFVEHLAAALLVWAFLLLALVGVGLCGYAANALVGSDADVFQFLWRAAGLAMLGGALVWLFFLLWNGYRQQAWLAALKAPAALACVVASHLLFRPVEFLMVYALT